MIGSIKIGSVLGITIRVHVLLLVLAGFVILSSGQDQWLQSAVLLAMIFGIILLHELAHSVVAMRFGLRVVDITLWPLGGMARMSQMPESSRIESLVAIAGPALNFVLAAVGTPILIAVWNSDSSFARELALSFVWGNLVLGGFNLLPAFPMDGGRVLRALLGRNGNWVRGTEQAVTIGRAIGVMLGLVGALLIVTGWMIGQGILFILVAMFVWWAGAQELMAVRARHGLDPLAAFREFAARATGWSQTRSATEFARAPSIDPPPRRDPPPLRNESASSASSAGSKSDAGFTDEELARLEQFRGPLSSFGPPPKS